MTLHERLLRLSLGVHKACAVLGDLEEEAARHGAPHAWIRRQALRMALSAAVLAARRTGRHMVTTLRLALRDARRSLVRFPATTLAAIAILSISMGAGAATFAVVDTVVFRPLPYASPERLVTIFGRTPKVSRSALAPADYYALQDGTTSLEGVAAWREWPLPLSDASGTEQATMVIATASLFDVLRERPVLGRVFGREHETPGRDAVAVIGHGLWQRRYAGDPGVLGQTLQTPTGPVTVIGVMPHGFGFPVEAGAPPVLWRPFAPQLGERTITAESGRASYLKVIARLKDEASIEQARADVERVFGGLAEQFPMMYADAQPATELLLDALTERVARWMRLVLMAVAVLIAIGCVNVSNLLLTRSERQAKDISVRLSLGASRMQVVAGLVLESLLLSTAATVLGLLGGRSLLAIVKAALPSDIVRAASIQLDARVFAACAAAGLLTALVAGLIPGWHASRVPPAQTLKAAAGATTRSRRAWQSALLVSQVALVTTLIVATTLLVGSFVQVVRADLGFSRQNLLGVSLNARAGSAKDRAAVTATFYRRSVDAVRAVPGVSEVAMQAGGLLPLYTGATMTRLSPPGDDAPGLTADLRSISSDYFSAAGIRLIDGRPFVAGDKPESVVIVDEFAASRLFDGRRAVGQTLVIGGHNQVAIVGVTANVKLLGPEKSTQPQVYRPLSDERENARMMLVRTTMDPSHVIPALRSALAAVVGPQSATMRIDVVEDQFRVLTADRRFSAAVMAALGLLALMIGVSGVYATTASVVAQQTKEIGIRMALGASVTRVVRTVTAATARLLLIGAVIGLAASWATAGVLTSVVFGIQPTHPVAYVVPLVTMTGCGCLAALLPARRAARVDPLIALRSE